MITLFSSLFATHGTFHSCTSAALVRALSRPKVYADKSSAPRWAAFRSVDGRRRREDLIEIHALVFDVDDPIALGDLVEALDDLHASVASTWSATEAAPRWRVVIFLSRPISVAEFSRVQRAAVEAIEKVATIDRAALGPEHIFSAPAISRADAFFACAEIKGETLGVDGALERFPAEQRHPIEHPPVIACGDVFARAQRYVARIPGAISGSGGRQQTHSVARALAGFVRAGLGEDAARMLFAEYNDRCDPPWREKELRQKLAWALERAERVPNFESRRAS